MTNIACPYCSQARLSTVRTAHSVRGFLIAYQQSTKTFVGCVRCVASELRKEAGRSLLYGWFSATALMFNVFLIPYHFVRSFLVKEDPEAVIAFLAEVGVPADDGDAFDIADACYTLAAAMVRADGKIDVAEISAAEEIGARLLEEFDDAAFRKYVNEAKFSPDVETLGRVLSGYLEEAHKTMLVRYLTAIAFADGACSDEEAELLARAATALGLDARAVKQIMDEAAPD